MRSRAVKRVRWNPCRSIDAPKPWREPREVVLAIDLFDGSYDRDFIDHVFAVMASKGVSRFMVPTAHLGRAEVYLRSVIARSRGAAEKYERRMRAHFRKYKRRFTEGYSLPEPPTPELRVIYDSAAKRESRPTNPCGTTLRSGFSHGEYHWRQWPLDNVDIVETRNAAESEAGE